MFNRSRPMESVENSRNRLAYSRTTFQFHYSWLASYIRYPMISTFTNIPLTWTSWLAQGRPVDMKLPDDTVDGCEILHPQKDGWNMLKAYQSWHVYQLSTGDSEKSQPSTIYFPWKSMVNITGIAKVNHPYVPSAKRGPTWANLTSLCYPGSSTLDLTAPLFSRVPWWMLAFFWY